ncbi:MAG: group III truncated hemoglobin [Cyclobacteriaceae bacterium]|nr:group III truncated hemoglobin [Cyclobacteriaceae bacterium]
MKKDIESRTDIELLVNQFYHKVKQDVLLAPVFNHVDWPEHLPVMYNFWSSMLLGDQSYQGSPFQKHMPLAIDARHFQQWLALFTQTVDEHFTGEKADEVKSRARSIAALWQHKKEMYSKN